MNKIKCVYLYVSRPCIKETCSKNAAADAEVWAFRKQFQDAADLSEEWVSALHATGKAEPNAWRSRLEIVSCPDFKIVSSMSGIFR